MRRNGRCFNIYHHEILIKIPSHLYKISIPKPGYVQIKLSDDIFADKSNVQQEEFQKWTDSSNFILPSKFNKWAEEILMELFKIKSFTEPANKTTVNNYSISIEKTNTYDFKFHVINNKSSDEFEVHTTFILYFDYFPSVFLDQHNEISGEAWIAVPIIPSHQMSPNYKQWRYSFPNIEKTILTDQNYLKCVLKLVSIIEYFVIVKLYLL